MPPSIAVLITCHNRKSKTLECLNHLFLQKDLHDRFLIDVFLVDDGCTDGTGDAISKQFPNVNIISGDGNLFWNRGMHLAWKTAAAFKEFDYYLWLNDDTLLFSHAVEKILDCISFDTIVCGSTSSSVSSKLTYGGYRNKKLILPNGKAQQCDFFNGNIVMIPLMIYKAIGYNDPFFHHALGDFDYGLRAVKAGFKLRIAPVSLGICESNDFIPRWRSSSVNVFKRFKYLYSPSSGCNPIEYFYFDKRHNGLITACFHYLTINIRAICPNLWKYF